jgi:hypothetical protein
MNWDAVGSWDAIALALLAIMDLALLAHLRHQRAHAAQMKRMMTSLSGAIRHVNAVAEVPERRSWLRASFGD